MVYAEFISSLVEVITYVEFFWIRSIIEGLIASLDWVACVASRDRQLLQKIFRDN